MHTRIPLAFLFLLCSTLSTADTVSTDPSPSPTFTNATLFALTILNSTNTYRAQHNVSSLTWNDTLATFATQTANTCIFSHSGGPYGENLVAGYADATSAVDAWGDERAEYDWSAPGFGEATGHFTQLVWRDTTTVGCAAVDCEGDYKGTGSAAPGWFVVCEYWPRGNVLGEFASEVLPFVGKDGGGDDGESGIGIGSGSARVMNGGQIAGALVVGGLMVGLFIMAD